MGGVIRYRSTVTDNEFVQAEFGDELACALSAFHWYAVVLPAISSQPLGRPEPESKLSRKISQAGGYAWSEVQARQTSSMYQALAWKPL